MCIHVGVEKHERDRSGHEFKSVGWTWTGRRPVPLVSFLNPTTENPFRTTGETKHPPCREKYFVENFWRNSRNNFFPLFFFFCKSYVNGQRREKGRKKKATRRSWISKILFPRVRFLLHCAPVFEGETGRIASLSAGNSRGKGERNFGIL